MIYNVQEIRYDVWKGIPPCPSSVYPNVNLNTAIMLSEIYSEYTYWESQGKLEQGGWFFSTVENMYCQTGLSKHQQLKACNELVDYGIIKVKYQGLPKKRYFKFDPAMFDYFQSIQYTFLVG